MNDTDMKISFVMPAYNCADTIKEAVESIMETNFHDGDELIIVNDGSTDNTKKAILGIQKKYPLTVCIDNPENAGCPATRNIGIRKARNPLIFNMDGDDILAPDSVLPLKKYLLDNAADVAAFAESRYFRRGPGHITHKAVTKGGMMTLADHLAGPIGPGGNCLYTKASWQKIGGYSELGKGLHEYWGFFLKQLANSARFFVLENSFYYHRYGRQSLYTREAKKKDESGAIAMQMILPHLNLITTEDAQYIQSEYGRKNWFDNLSSRPIRVKSGDVGIAGHKVFIADDKTFLDSVKKVLPRSIINPLKKIYLYIRKRV